VRATEPVARDLVRAVIYALFLRSVASWH